MLKTQAELPSPKRYLYTADGNPGELIYPVQVDNHLNGSDIDQGSAGETLREQCDHPRHEVAVRRRVVKGVTLDSMETKQL